MNLVDLRQVGHVEQLRTEEQIGKLRLRPDDVFDSRGFVTLPSRPGNQKYSSIVAEGACTEVGEVVGVEIDHLAGVVPVGLDLRHSHNQRLRAQVHP